MNSLVIEAVKKGTEVTKHAILRTISVVCVLLVVVGVSWAVYVTMIKPHVKPTPTTTEYAEKIYHIYYYPNKKTFGFGLTLWGTDIGLSKYDYPKEPIVKVELVKKEITK